MWTIEVNEKKGIFDAVGEGIKKDILDLGISGVRDVRFIQVYFINGDLGRREITAICEELLVDPISQAYCVNPPVRSRTGARETTVEVSYNPGVMDPVEESALKGIRDMGIAKKVSLKTAKKYLLTGEFSSSQLTTITEKLLYNKLIQHIVTASAEDTRVLEGDEYQFRLVTVDLLGVSDRRLKEISVQGQLFLNLDEMRQIRDYFKGLKRNPTGCELETIAQTWSEHCWHKTFRGRIRYTELPAGKSDAGSTPKTKLINNLLKSTIMKATGELKKSWCVSVFKDNSGVIKFDDTYNVCFKVETHNHPSALEPFGGANTGIGGVIRDPLGTGMGAKPFLNTDVFCFGPPDYPFEQLPPGCLHPKRVMKGVVSGVRDYGNKMGIPTVNGAVLFHERFVGNPLVYCGTAGIMPANQSFKHPRKGDLVVVAGGRTGRDGIHGATFSSGELTHESEKVSSGAVQIGNPIQEKKIVDAVLQARDRGLYNAITDCGAGGLSSAVGEMGQELGARVDLEKVPLKYSGLSYEEIWISESQERMVMAVPPEKLAALQEIFAQENAEAVAIGEYPGTGRLELYYKGTQVCDLDMEFLHEGLPRTEKKAVFAFPRHREPEFSCPQNLTTYLLKLLSHYNVCSKEWIIRQYDHEVQGGSIIKPLTGIANDGPSDAAVVKPLLHSSRGIIVSNGINFRYGFIDPYWMSASCIDEALRQVIAVGGSLERTAILDNFCWGNPDKPDRLGGLVRAALGCYDAAKGFSVPFISGKDSMYNEFTVNNRSLSIPGTLLISAVSVLPDVSRAVSMDAKHEGDLIYVVGETADELGASLYFDAFSAVGNRVPHVSFGKARRMFDTLSTASSRGLIRAMHDCSEGGIGVSAAEMAFAGGLGMELFLSEVPYKQLYGGKWNTDEGRNDFVLFSESNSRFVVEVAKRDQKVFEKILRGIPFALAGCLSADKEFKVYGLDGKVCVRTNIDELKLAWKEPLQW
ncbi:MAG: phosphoribosylformylglycinamidine synthase subunit PurL [Candidatus Omnitrophota bacterium]|jgi:phosphoribosylformylglycinamidine synthase